MTEDQVQIAQIGQWTVTARLVGQAFWSRDSHGDKPAARCKGWNLLDDRRAVVELRFAGDRYAPYMDTEIVPLIAMAMEAARQLATRLYEQRKVPPCPE